MDHDVIPPLPFFVKGELQNDHINNHFEALKKSESMLIVYETESGNTEILFKYLDERLFANMVAKLNDPLHLKVYEFLKLTMEGARLIKVNTKESYANAVRIEKHMKNVNIPYQ